MAYNKAIVTENALTGNPDTEWDLSGTGSTNIEGFATDISVNWGQTIYFKINTNSNNYLINIYRLGYYGGMGARKVASITVKTATPQPPPITDPNLGLVDAGNWSVSASWAVPAETSDTTSHAYNGRGGYNLYGGGAAASPVSRIRGVRYA